jgi:hypothetical protein
MSADKLSKTELYYQTNESMDKLKILLEKQRRMPESRSMSTRDRFDSSFRNSRQMFNDKLARDIQKFKGRLSVSKDRTSAT